MFISKKKHQFEIDQIQEMNRSIIHSLERLIEIKNEQISDLRQLVFPKVSKVPDPIVMEADSVMSGSDKPIEVSEKEHNKLLEESREMDLLFSGNYSEDLLQ
jgi:transcriptional regulator with AAA-type ATPase domain